MERINTCQALLYNRFNISNMPFSITVLFTFSVVVCSALVRAVSTVNCAHLETACREIPLSTTALQVLKAVAGYQLPSQSLYNESLSTNIFPIVHKVWINNLEGLGTKLEDNFGSLPQQRLLRSKMCQRAFKLVMLQLPEGRGQQNNAR